MEENQKKQKSNGKTLFTVALSLFVAIAAIVSLVGVGFNQVSYAAETPPESTTTDIATQSFTMKQEEDPARIGFGRFNVPIYYRLDESGKKIPVFCVEHAVSPALDLEYKLFTGDVPGSLASADDKVKFGILKLLDEKDIALSNISNDTLKQAVVQAAIWKFLYEKLGNSSPNFHSLTHGFNTSLTNEEAIEELEGFGDITVYNAITGSDSAKFTPTAADITNCRNGIKKLVDIANSATNNERELKVTPASKNLHQTQDKKFYISDAIKVEETTNTNTMQNYIVTASGIEGLKIVDKDNKEKSQFPAGSDFYVQVPADKVTDVKKTININVKGTFDGILTGRYYVHSDDTQKIVTVEKSTKVVPGSTTLEVVGTKDTAMSSVQTIYFIGLVVLLCGIGIIYANAKPVEEK